MSYCNKCGKEIPEGSYCADCKINNLNSKVEQNKKNNLIIFGIFIGIVVILGVLYFTLNAKVIDNQKEKECPYECCKESSGFIIKPCSNLYECKESRCIAIDSDEDGLTDIKEEELGTNPINQNSDNDRYNDGIDTNPLTPNSANIDVILTSKSWDWKYGNIALTFIGGGIINPDLVIAEPKASVEVTNLGNDYTSFVDFSIIFKISNTLISRKEVHINKFNVGDNFQEIYIQEITAGEVPDLLINLIKEGTNDWGIEIQNLNYEKFS
ncbi:hypothetical protein M0R72_04285 [Candidatus Pacearchaeota archaeon]|jgi:predicted nucleic acid-binding Zn ribbon protein|nr:hypothetical protein [Candidatus Pacearchaeota archaeon]